MPVPMDSNEQDNYDLIQGTPMHPHDHPSDNIQPATDHHDGTTLDVGPRPKEQRGSEGGPKKETVGDQALQALKERMQGGSTKTKGKK